MKIKSILICLVLVVGLLAGCSSQDEPADVVSTPSYPKDEAAFLEAVSSEGAWIIITTEDVTIKEEIVVEGEFRNKDKADGDIYRKLALYAQDENRTVTERYSLTAPKMTVKSPNFRIQGGTFKGDVYVEANGFNIRDAKIEGNVYFANEEYQSTFEIGEGGEVTGTTEVSGNNVDAISASSFPTDAATFLKSVGTEGKWIICTTADLTIDEEIVVEGEFHNKDDASKDIYRKLALYAQDSNRTVTERFTLTAPKMTVKSPNFRIQGGTFAGDIYVEANGFNIRDAKVEGNIYFANEEYKSSFELGEGGEVTGVTEVK